MLRWVHQTQLAMCCVWLELLFKLFVVFILWQNLSFATSRAWNLRDTAYLFLCFPCNKQTCYCISAHRWHNHSWMSSLGPNKISCKPENRTQLFLEISVIATPWIESLWNLLRIQNVSKIDYNEHDGGLCCKSNEIWN